MTTAADVLRCDHCRCTIDDLETGMLYWRPRAREEEDAKDLSLQVAHKRCQERRRSEDRELGEYSAELYWFADQACAALRIADMAIDFAFSAEELKRLILLTWAVPIVGSNKNQEDAQRFAEFF